VFFPMNYAEIVVETAGVEPASAQNGSPASTCVSFLWRRTGLPEGGIPVSSP